MRVFVPMTMSGLRRLHERGGLGQPPTFGCAVTPYLRGYYALADEEELEYLILGAAAHDSLRLLAADPDEERRRVVVAVEAPDGAVLPDPGAGRTAVLVSVDVALAQVVAVHIDGPEAMAAIAAATLAADAADLGDVGAAEIVAAAEDHELLWYGTQEIPYLL